MISINKLRIQTTDGVGLIQEANLEISPQLITGLYGPNGSGKTSLLKAISGEEIQNTIFGEVWVEQKLVSSGTLTAQERAKTILYLGSDFYTPFQISVRELLEMSKSVNSKSNENVFGVAERLKITALLNRSFDRLSDGEKQMVMIARGLVQSPLWLVLDETFSKIDLERSFVLGNELKIAADNGMGIILASHDLNLLSEYCDDLWLVKSGKLIRHGSVEEVLTVEGMRELYPSRAVHVVRSPESGKKKVIY